MLSILVFAFALPNVITPWVQVDFQGDGVIQPWRDGVEGSVDALVWIALVGLVLDPLARPIVGQLLVVVAAVAVTVVPAAGPAMAVTLVIILLPVISYPALRRLRDLRAPDVHRGTMAVAVATSAVLLPLAVAAWSPSDNQAATYAEHLAVLALAGLVFSTRRPGWRWVAWPTAATWAYLGVVAIAHPDEIDSFGRLGGLACLATAAAFAVLTARTTEATRPPSSARRPAER